MFTRSEIKQMAKQQISGNIGILFLCSLVIFLIMIPGSIVGFFIVPSFTVSVLMIYLNLAKGTRPEVGDIFKGFEVFGKALWLNIIMNFFITLWSLLFLIPGIIKSISYSMSFYILADNPTMTAREALNESKRIMHGHKWEYFVLGLSFIGWILLTCITFGLAGIYAMPYMNATYINFYNKIKAEN